MKGIEPSYAVWETAVLPLNYTRVVGGFIARRALVSTGNFGRVARTDQMGTRLWGARLMALYAMAPQLPIPPTKAWKLALGSPHRP